MQIAPPILSCFKISKISIHCQRQTITSSGQFNIFLTKARAKDAAQNTPKYAISSEKSLLLWGEARPVADSSLCSEDIPFHILPLLPAKPLESAHASPKNSKQIHVTAFDFQQFFNSLRSRTQSITANFKWCRPSVCL